MNRQAAAICAGGIIVTLVMVAVVANKWQEFLHRLFP